MSAGDEDDLKEIAERGPVRVEQVVVRQVRLLAEDQERRDARLLEWEVLVPTAADAAAALKSVADAGVAVERTADGGTARDPWGTPVRVRAIQLA